MPDLQQSNVVGVCCSDIHLSHKPPVARSLEKNWYAAQGDQLRQAINLANKHKCPLIVAGDIFDKPMNPPQLVNWAMEYFASAKYGVYAIPGQHDLLHHSIEDIGKTSYWTLALSKAIFHMSEVSGYECKDTYVQIHAFPWGKEIVPFDSHFDKTDISIAVCHRYVHKKGHSFPGADPKQSVGETMGLLKGYDAAIFGDNHSGFSYHKVFNCGALIRRNQKERKYTPRVGLILDDGVIIPKELVTFDDVFSDAKEEQKVEQVSLEVQELLDSFEKVLDESESLGQALMRYTTQVSVSKKVVKRIKEIVNELD